MLVSLFSLLKHSVELLFYFLKLINQFNFGCVGSALLSVGFSLQWLLFVAEHGL